MFPVSKVCETIGSQGEEILNVFLSSIVIKQMMWKVITMEIWAKQRNVCRRKGAGERCERIGDTDLNQVMYLMDFSWGFFGSCDTPSSLSLPLSIETVTPAWQNQVWFYRYWLPKAKTWGCYQALHRQGCLSARAKSQTGLTQWSWSGSWETQVRVTSYQDKLICMCVFVHHFVNFCVVPGQARQHLSVAHK